MVQRKLQLGVALAASAAFGIAANATAEGLVVSSVFDPSVSDGRIEILRTDGSARQVVRETGSGLRGVAANSEWLFWSDVEASRIDRVSMASPAGTSTGIVTSGAVYAQDVELSHATENIFWIDATRDQIMAANLDGSDVRPVFSINATSIAVDDLNQKIYAENRSSASRGSIVRANFDGSNVETVIKEVPTATDMSVDPVNGYVFWTSSAGLTDGNGGVYRVSYDGSDFREVFVLGSNLDTSGISVDVENGHVYWGQNTAANRSDIYRMNLDGSDTRVVSSGYGNISDMAYLSQFPDLPLIVSIDIVPGITQNIVHPRSRGHVWVAVLSDVDRGFDPLQIDMETVGFGPEGASPSSHRVRDLNRDGIGDLWLRFRVQETGIASGDTSASLSGKTFHGDTVTGADRVITPAELSLR